ncbi:hypothetical protein DL93DRAFT_2084204 [Clavulina sp. PMI_390]|nr:hypothetical protein DL93DRAFT_2084204 [Clavulina sp. PMI_390]
MRVVSLVFYAFFLLVSGGTTVRVAVRASPVLAADAQVPPSVAGIAAPEAELPRRASSASVLSGHHAVARGREKERRSYGGKGTYYYPGKGACGWHNTSSDLIVAMSAKMYKAHCGKMITITSKGKTHTAKVVDECPECGAGDLDMSPGLFKKFAPESQGVISVQWKFN